MGGWFSLEENSVFKLWTLFLLRQRVKYEQEALKATVDIIKHGRLFSDELGLEAEWDAGMAAEVPRTERGPKQ